MIEQHITRKILVSGILLGIIEIALFFTILLIDSKTALKILTMIGSCHVGGRLAFISTGFEMGFTSLPVLSIILLYNTTFVLVVYSVFVVLSQRVSKFRFIARLHQEVYQSRKVRSQWNLISIAIFIWIPLPMTGAVVGSLIAYFEGYKDKQIIFVALSAMWFGVISWTLAFDRMYQILRKMNPSTTIVCTLLLLLLPLVYNLIRKNKKLD